MTAPTTDMDRPDATAAFRGLTSTEAATRLRRDGRNETRAPASASIARRILAQVLDPLIMLLLGAAVVTAATGDLTDTSVILLVIVVNTTIGVVQEVRADRAIAALRSLGAPTSRVMRDGTDVVIPAGEVVVGDLVRLAAGDIVPADIRVQTANRLLIDESAVTGESVAVPHDSGEEVLAGTVVTSGRASGVVVRVGAASALGQIVELTERARGGPTPLQRKLARLGRTLAIWTVAVSGVVAALGIIRGRPVIEMAIVGVSLVVAAVPESLPAVVTLALALGARRMSAAKALTRRLTAVETLGSVTVLISDKTGTLTQGTMAVQRATTASGAWFTVTGTGYEPTGLVTADGREEAVGPSAELCELARAAALCNDAELIAPTSEHRAWMVAGEHIEGALLAFAQRVGVDVEAVRKAAPRTAEEPFDQATHRMMTTHIDDGEPIIVVKGAPETVLTTDVLDDQAHVTRLRQAAADLAESGLRALAVAAGRPGALRALGVVGIGDPARPEASSATAELLRAGVRTVMVTGDHPLTGKAIAEQVGIWRPDDRFVVCADGDGRPDISEDVRVVARARPDDKLRIVGDLKARGEVVAVTGDGVNDAPALRRADIGVAMGSGTEVAQQAAQLVLANDDLGTLEIAVAEGRRVYANIRRFLRYALAGGVAELLTMLVGPLFGLAVPLLPAQILWINLLTHGLPGVAMGAEPASEGIMRRPPRSPEESVLGAGLGRAVLWTGGLIAVCTLAVGAGAAAAGWDWQPLVYLTLGLSQLGVALAVRTHRRSGRGNPWLGIAVASSVVLLLGGVYLAPLNALLETTAVPALELSVSVVAAVIPGLAVAAARRRADRHYGI